MADWLAGFRIKCFLSTALKEKQVFLGNLTQVARGGASGGRLSLFQTDWIKLRARVEEKKNKELVMFQANMRMR